MSREIYFFLSLQGLYLEYKDSLWNREFGTETGRTHSQCGYLMQKKEEILEEKRKTRRENINFRVQDTYFKISIKSCQESRIQSLRIEADFS